MTETVKYRGIPVPGYVARNIDAGTHGARWFRKGVDAVLDAPKPAPKPAPLIEFTPWPKTPRFFRDIVITEKLDGTNAAIHIVENPELPGTYVVQAQSRNRLIFPGKSTDNYGFAQWVSDNSAELVTLLGAGLHFGEWWGQGIGRGYNQQGRTFSLFNVDRHAGLHQYAGGARPVGDAHVTIVPVLYRGPLTDGIVGDAMRYLADTGSDAAPGFMRPEGICVFHTQSRQVFKVTLDNQDAGKWEASA